MLHSEIGNLRIELVKINHPVFIVEKNQISIYSQNVHVVRNSCITRMRMNIVKINPEITIQNITFGGMSKKSFNINKMAKGIKQTIAVPSVRKTRGTNIATAIRL